MCFARAGELPYTALHLAHSNMLGSLCIFMCLSIKNLLANNLGQILHSKTLTLSLSTLSRWLRISCLLSDAWFIDSPQYPHTTMVGCFELWCIFSRLLLTNSSLHSGHSCLTSSVTCSCFMCPCSCRWWWNLFSQKVHWRPGASCLDMWSGNEVFLNSLMTFEQTGQIFASTSCFFVLMDFSDFSEVNRCIHLIDSI